MPPDPRPPRRPTLTDVAREAGVSPALASIVMRGVPGASEANRERVHEVARRLGYVPDARARVLRQGRSHLLGVLFSVHQPFHADVVEGVYAAARDAGFDVVLSAVTATRGEQEAVDTLVADRCEALLLLGTTSPRAWIADLAARLPVVVVSRRVSAPGVDVVRTADARGIALAVDHLVALGHTAIAHVDGAGMAGSAERRQGYRAAMRRHGLEALARVVPGGSTEDDGVRAAADLLACGELPTGILAFNDRCATGVLDVLHRAGVPVPGQVSVVGYDDTHLARFSQLDLTTVRQDAAAIAGSAVLRAVARLAGDAAGEPPGSTVVPPTLVVRGTSGPARQAARRTGESTHAGWRSGAPARHHGRMATTCFTCAAESAGLTVAVYRPCPDCGAHHRVEPATAPVAPAPPRHVVDLRPVALRPVAAVRPAEGLGRATQAYCPDDDRHLVDVLA